DSRIETASADQLELLDGGSNHEKVSFSSLLVKARGLDVVVVIDGSADNQNYWPNDLERISSVLSSSHQPIPPIPGTAAQFVSTGFNMRPTFFGCNLTQGQLGYSIIIYLMRLRSMETRHPRSTLRVLHRSKIMLISSCSTDDT
ncbi:hypothetical protein BDR06DRAFT_877929, partial [Suillus hirtellus]